MPGVGPKTAERLAFYILKSKTEVAQALSDAMIKTKMTTRFCGICNNLSENESCDICQDTRRDRSVMCIVEDPNDIASI